MALGMGHKTITIPVLGNTGDSVFLQAATQTSAGLYTVQGACRVVGIRAICYNETGGVTGATVDVLNATTSLLASTITVCGAAQANLGTEVTGTLTATDANRILADGDQIRCTVVVTGVGTSVTGIVVYVELSEL